LITDGRKVQVLDLFPGINGVKVIFECDKDELKEKFSELYGAIGKPILIEYYSKLIS
jgi:hypothetical protein